MDKPLDDMERDNRIPRGYLVLFIGLIAWAVGYIALYTPQISGWSQYDTIRKDLEAEKRLAAATPTIHDNPYEQDPKAVAEGQVLYDENCGGCHGKGLRGDSGPALTGHLKFGENDAALYESIAQGRPAGMPDFARQLGRDRIWKVVSYVDSHREPKKSP